MCVMSMVMDHYYDKWKDYTIPYPPQPNTVPMPSGPWNPAPQTPPIPCPWPPYSPLPAIPTQWPVNPITPQDIEEFRKLLDRARKYDKDNNEPDCELEEKRKKVKDLAERLGVEIDFL
jgi:hypothetical protein